MRDEQQHPALLRPSFRVVFYLLLLTFFVQETNIAIKSFASRSKSDSFAAETIPDSAKSSNQ